MYWTVHLVWTKECTCSAYCCPKDIDCFNISLGKNALFLSFSFLNARIYRFCLCSSKLDIFRSAVEVFTILSATALYTALIRNLQMNKCVGEKLHSDSYYPSVWREKLKSLLHSYTTVHFISLMFYSTFLKNGINVNTNYN